MARILVIEDDEFVRKMLQQTFERKGFEVSVASNGEIGCRLYIEPISSY